MLNLKGSYVVIGAKAPIAHILGADQEALFQDRSRVVGLTKAVKYQFGNDAVAALPTTRECMEFIALNFVGPHQEAVRGMCAKIALGQPLSDGKDITEGGTHAKLDPPKPRKPSPSAKVALTAEAQS